MLTFDFPLVVSGSMASDITGPAQQMTNMIYMSIQCVWTGTPTGTLAVQACNDAKITSSSTWTTLTTSSSLTLNGSQPAGSASDCMFNNNATGVPWPWIRLIYTAGSSTGTLNAKIFAKGV